MKGLLSGRIFSFELSHAKALLNLVRCIDLEVGLQHVQCLGFWGDTPYTSEKSVDKHHLPAFFESEDKISH